MKDWQKKFDKWYKDNAKPAVAWAVSIEKIMGKVNEIVKREREKGWQAGHKQTREDYQEILKRILTDLHCLRANIPLTYGKGARKQAKELIGKIEQILKQTK